MRIAVSGSRLTAAIGDQAVVVVGSLIRDDKITMSDATSQLATPDQRVTGTLARAGAVDAIWS